jgi:hypothetical protein
MNGISERPATKFLQIHDRQITKKSENAEHFAQINSNENITPNFKE